MLLCKEGSKNPLKQKLPNSLQDWSARCSVGLDEIGMAESNKNPLSIYLDISQQTQTFALMNFEAGQEFCLYLFIYLLLSFQCEKSLREDLAWSSCVSKITNSSGVADKDPRSAALGWISTLNWAELPSFGQQLLQAIWTNYPRHTCSYFCSVSAQQVYTGEINVTALRKGKANAGARRINHLSEWSSQGLSSWACQRVEFKNLEVGVKEAVSAWKHFKWGM